MSKKIKCEGETKTRSIGCQSIPIFHVIQLSYIRLINNQLKHDKWPHKKLRQENPSIYLSGKVTCRKELIEKIHSRGQVPKAGEKVSTLTVSFALSSYLHLLYNAEGHTARVHASLFE